MRHPTGLYIGQLPQETAPGNIAWTISTQEPIRANVRVLRLPSTEEIRPLPAGLFDPATRRAAEGPLILTLLRASRSSPGSNKKQFEIGELIEFDNTPVAPLQPVPVPNTVEILHNTNILDLQSIGLSDNDVNTLTTQSEIKKRTLETQLTTIKTLIANIQVNIVENQKKLNETIKVLGATRQIFGITDGDESFQNDIYQKLLAIQRALETEQTNLNTSYNTQLGIAQTTYNGLLQISELVR